MMLGIINTLDNEGEIVQAVILNEMWCKPLSELTYNFDEYMCDVNLGITNALWRRDPLLEGRLVDFLDTKKLLPILQSNLISFWERYNHE